MAFVGWLVGWSVGCWKKVLKIADWSTQKCCLVIGYNVSEMINEWGAYAGVLPQTADPQSREVSVHKESLQIDCRIQV